MTPHALDATTFRRLLGTFASGVTVVTTRDAEGAPAGMTATAFCSLSLDPPLILVCIAHDSSVHAALRGAPCFGVNILADHQTALSEQFAATQSDRFAGVALARDEGPDPPVLSGTAGFLLCETTDVLPGGDHTIFIGRVVGGEASDRLPLLHFRGDYRYLAS